MSQQAGIPEYLWPHAALTLLRQLERKWSLQPSPMVPVTRAQRQADVRAFGRKEA